MRRLAPALAAVLLALGPRPIDAREPDLRAPEIRALRAEYAAARAALAAKRLDVLRSMLQNHIEEQRGKQRRARISGNTTQKADAAQALQIFGQALETLEREGTFAFPAKIRPALERMVALCAHSLESEDAARDAGFKLLDTRFAGRLQPLLAQQGITAGPEQLARFWQAVLADAGEEASSTGAASPAGASSSAADAPQAAPDAAADEAPVAAGAPAGTATNDAVLDSRGEASAWAPVVRIGIEVAAIEVIALPVAGLTGRVERKGTGIESGAPWQAAVTPLRAFTPPADGPAPAMRIRAVPGRHAPDVLEWPSRRNGWMIELRVRPPAPGLSRHGCVLEINAADANH